MSLSKLASWMNKPVNNDITFQSSSFVHLYTMPIFFYVPSLGKNSWEIILQQFVAFWT